MKTRFEQFYNFLNGKWAIQIWGVFDLLTLILFWEYFYNYITHSLVSIFDKTTDHLLLLPTYSMALLSLSLFYSGIFLLLRKKIPSFFSFFQAIFRLFLALPSIFPILWLIGYNIEKRYYIFVVMMIVIFDLLRFETLEKYFKK